MLRAGGGECGISRFFFKYPITFMIFKTKYVKINNQVVWKLMFESRLNRINHGYKLLT